MKIEYIIKCLGDTYPDEAVELQSDVNVYNNKLTLPEYSYMILAQEAAEHCWKHGAGQDFNWPLDFEIFIDGASVGVFEVYIDTRHAELEFQAERK